MTVTLVMLAIVGLLALAALIGQAVENRRRA